jgi:hypothetical protein
VEGGGHGDVWMKRGEDAGMQGHAPGGSPPSQAVARERLRCRRLLV